MKILLIDNALDTHSRRFSLMLLSAGHVIAYVSETNILSDQEKKITHYPYPIFTWTYGIRPYRLGKIIRDFLAGLRLRRIWKKFKPDVTHVLLIQPSVYHCTLAGIHPLVLTSFGSDINELFESKSQDEELKRRIGKTLQSADYITADTSDVLQKCNELTKKKLRSGLFYFGIDLNLFKPALSEEKEKLRNSLGISPASKIILSPRRLIYKMRHDLILKAFAKIVMQNNLNAMLVLRKYGSFSIQCETDLKNLAVELGITNNLLWVDQMDYEKLPVLYSLSNLVINVPEQDGLPVALFEASACMTAVITSNLPAYQEFLSKGEYYRINEWDQFELTKAMEFFLYDNSPQIIESIKKNYALVALEADQRKSISTIENIYHQIIKINV